MTQPRAGRAAIEIVGDVTKLGRQLQRDTQRAIDNTDLNTHHISDQIGDAFADGATAAIQALDKAVPEIASLLEGAADAAGTAAENVEEGFVSAAGAIGGTFKKVSAAIGGFLSGVGEKAVEVGQGIQENLLQPLQRGFSRIGDLIASAGSALAGVAISSINPAGLATFAAYAAAFTLLIPLVIGLAAALSSLAGVLTVLPAVIGGAASALIVGTIAFQGFGDALSAIMEGDPEQIAEALKELAPAARAVAREFQAILPGLRQVGDMIQQRFFEPLIGQLELFGTRTLPLVRDELGDLSTALGRAVSDLGDMAQSTKNVEILGRAIDSTSIVTDKLGGAFAKLGDSLFEALDASLPMLEQLGAGLADAISGFADWLSGSVKDGSFQEFWDSAIDTLGRVWNLVKAVGDLFGTLFEGTEEGGKDFIDTLTDLTKRLTEFFKSTEGQEALQDFVEIMGAAGSIIGYVVNAIRWFIDVFTELDDALEAVIFFFEDLWDKVVEVWDGITSSTGSAVDSVGQFFTDLWTDITEIWDGIVQTVSDAVDSVVTFFTELPGRIWNFIKSIPGMVAAAFDAMVDQALTILAYMVAAVIVFFTDLPGQIAGAIDWFVNVVKDGWNAAVEWISQAWDTIVGFVESVPERLQAGWDAIWQQIVSVFTTIKDWVISTWESIVTFFSGLPARIGAFFTQLWDAVVKKVTSVIEYVKGLPGRIITAIGNAGKMLYDSGAKIIQGLIDGIGSKISQLKQKIASAVQEIRDHLPFSPAKKGPLSGQGSPQRAGATIGSMIAAGLDSQLALIGGAASRAADAAGISLSPLGDAGAAPLLGPNRGANSGVMSPVEKNRSETPVVVVYVDGEELAAVVDKRVEVAVQAEVRRLMAGTRGI